MLHRARVAMGQRVIAIDPAHPKESGFNVLDWIDPSSPTATADVRIVVDWILRRAEPASVNSIASASEFFQGRGKSMVEALLSDILFDPSLRPEERTLKTLAVRLALPEREMRAELERIHGSSPSPRARHLAGQLKQLVKETFSGVYGTMSEQTEWLANPSFAELVSGQSFTTRDLRAGRLDLFLNLNMKILEATPALGRCIVGALLNAVYEADGRVKNRVLFLLDEVARLGFMASLMRARDAGRKYGITLVLIYQSEGQLAEQWGEDGKAAWFESVTWRSYSAVADLRVAESISKACGEHGVVTVSRGDSKGVSRRQPLARGTKTSGESENRSEQRRRLITPDEIPPGYADRRADRLRARPKAAALRPRHLFPTARDAGSRGPQPLWGRDDRPDGKLAMRSDHAATRRHDGSRRLARFEQRRPAQAADLFDSTMSPLPALLPLSRLRSASAALSSAAIRLRSDLLRRHPLSSACNSAMCWSRVIRISCRSTTGRGVQAGRARVEDRRRRPAEPASGGAEMRSAAQHFGGTARPRGGPARPGTLEKQKRFRPPGGSLGETARSVGHSGPVL